MNKLNSQAVISALRNHCVQFSLCTFGLLIVLHLAAIGAPAFVGLSGSSIALAILIVRLKGRLNAVSGWRTFGDVLGDVGLAFLSGLLALLLTTALTQWNRPNIYDGGLPWRGETSVALVQRESGSTNKAPESPGAAVQAPISLSAAGQGGDPPPNPASEPSKVETKFEERLDKLGTTFQWLLAVLALALTVMTWLVGKAAKDAKEEAAAVRRELNVLGRIEMHELSICTHYASVQILFQMQKLDRNENHQERYVLGQFWRILTEGNGFGEPNFDPAAYQQMVDCAVLITDRALAIGRGFDQSAALFPLMRRTIEKLLEAMHKKVVVAGYPISADCAVALRRLLRLLE